MSWLHYYVSVSAVTAVAIVHAAICCVGLVVNNFVSFYWLLFSISPSSYSTANLVIIPN
jgi:hypothetical protein